MLKNAISFAKALKTNGIGKGDNVLSLMDNYHYMAPTWLGCIFAETVLCPFAMTDNSVKGNHHNHRKITFLTNIFQKTDEISDIINQIQPKIFVTSRIDLVESFKEIFKNLNLHCPIYIYENNVTGCYDLKPLLEQDVDIDEFKVPVVKDPTTEVVMLTLSSATTGKPKLINTTHMQLLSL